MKFLFQVLFLLAVSILSVFGSLFSRASSLSNNFGSFCRTFNGVPICNGINNNHWQSGQIRSFPKQFHTDFKAGDYPPPYGERFSRSFKIISGIEGEIGIRMANILKWRIAPERQFLIEFSNKDKNI
jgi:hypothetical protein